MVNCRISRTSVQILLLLLLLGLLLGTHSETNTKVKYTKKLTSSCLCCINYRVSLAVIWHIIIKAFTFLALEIYTKRSSQMCSLLFNQQVYFCI